MKFPIVFEETNVGWLRVEKLTRGPLPPATAAAIESLAMQLALLWKAPDVEAALELDRVVEKLKTSQPFYDWCGVYVVRGESLHLAAFRGAPTPHMVIAKAKGICGAAVAENKTLNIADVGADPRYLSCDSRTKSELVVPIRNAMGEAVAEIDIDSHSPAAFGEDAARQVEELARELSSLVLKLA